MKLEELVFKAKTSRFRLRFTTILEAVTAAVGFLLFFYHIKQIAKTCKREKKPRVNLLCK